MPKQVPTGQDLTFNYSQQNFKITNFHAYDAHLKIPLRDDAGFLVIGDFKGQWDTPEHAISVKNIWSSLWETCDKVPGSGGGSAPPRYTYFNLNHPLIVKVDSHAEVLGLNVIKTAIDEINHDDGKKQLELELDMTPKDYIQVRSLQESERIELNLILTSAI